MDELDEKLVQVIHDIDIIKSDMATNHDIESINEKLDRIDKRITSLRAEIIGWLENNIR